MYYRHPDDQTRPLQSSLPFQSAAEKLKRKTMLIRRIREHFMKQNWAGLTIDLVVVIAGVFLGIQAQQWVDDREQLRQEQRHLDRLEADFLSIQARLEEHFSVYENAIQGADYLFSLIGATGDQLPRTDVDRERLSSAINALSQQRVPPPSSATYLEMRDAGQLSMLRNELLRDKLAVYDQALDIMREISRMTIDTSVDQLPAIYRCIPVRARIDETALSGIRNEVVDFDLGCMQTSSEFEVAVTLLEQNAMNSLMQRKWQMRSIDELLALLDRASTSAGP